MVSTIGVPETMRRKMEGFAKSEKIPLAVVSPEAGDVRVGKSAGRQESSLTFLYAGGWIRCPVALALAQKLSMESPDLGKMLNLLKIKVRECSLGCFK